MEVIESCDSIAVSTRMRLARNFEGYPFPNRLLRDPHAAEQATEMISLISAELKLIDAFVLYEMKNISDENAAFLSERNLISRDLLANRKISAALVSKDERISVMINEEDHLRIQYFMKGFDLVKAYERVLNLEEQIAEFIPIAYDAQFGYLTACPTNLGTGLRASVMLFLPALSRRGRMRKMVSVLNKGGLTVRGAYGEGSNTGGDLFQISNEMTLGLSENHILNLVDMTVTTLTDMEITERMRMKAEEGLALSDELSRSYGVLTHCRKMDSNEFIARIADLKLAIALGWLGGEEKGELLMGRLDSLTAELRPANLNRLEGRKLSPSEQDVARASYAQKAIAELNLREN